MILFLLQGFERVSEETPGSSRRPSWFWYHKVLLLTHYILKGGDSTLNISVKVGDGELETTNSYRSQLSITEIRSSSMKSKFSCAMDFVTWAMTNAGIAQ